MAEIDYRECQHCGATTIMLRHYLTGSPIEIDPLPVHKGNIVVDWNNGLCSMVKKDRSNLWQAHVSSCSVYRSD